MMPKGINHLIIYYANGVGNPCLTAFIIQMKQDKVNFQNAIQVLMPVNSGV